MKKIISMLLVAIMLITFTTAAFAAPTVPGAVYSDQQAAGSNKPVAQIQQELQQAGIKDVTPTDWFAGSITVIVQSGLLAPSADGNFHPEATLNSGDGISVFAKVLGIAAKNDTQEQAVAKAQEAGLVSSGTTLTSDLSRMDVAKLLGKALGVEPKPVTNLTGFPFSDCGSASQEDLGLLKALYDLGIFRGYPEGDGKPSFRADSILTRAQIAILIDRILGAR